MTPLTYRFAVPLSRCLTAGFLILAGCGGGGAVSTTAPTQPVLSSVSLSASTAALTVGETYQLHANPKDQSGLPMSSGPSVTFGTADPAIATVSETGLVSGVAPGTTTVTVSATMAGVTRTATCEVTVSAAPPPGSGPMVSTAGFAFSPASVTIGVNDSVTWRFVEAPHNVTFSGTAPPAGNIATQQPGAQVTLVFATAGTYSYECTIHNGMTGQVIVQSGQAQTYTTLALAPATPAIAVGGTVQLTATPLDQNGIAMTGLVAASFTTSASTVATVSPTGLVMGIAGGSATITASLTSAGVTHSAVSTVTVTAPQPGSVTVTTPNQTFSPSTVTIATGGSVLWQFSGATHNVTFSGPAPTGGNIPDTPPGNAVSRSFATAGTYGYFCTRHGGMTGTVIVQAGSSGGTYTSLAVTPAAPTVGVGSTVQLTALPLDQNGASMAGLPAATFSSSAPGTASVTPAGLVSGMAPGTATITASLTASGVTHTAAATVTVTQGQPGGVTIATVGNVFTPNDVTIAPGTTVTWQFSGATHNVTFTKMMPPGGNIPDTAPGNNVSLTFLMAGDYDYICTHHSNMKGRIRVQ